MFRSVWLAAASAGEHIKDVTHVKTAEVKSLPVETALSESTESAVSGSAALGRLLESIRSHLVILSPLVGIGEDMVSLIDFLELLLCLFGIILIQVRMILTCKFSVCPFYIIFRGAFAYAKDIIVILAVCHKESTLFLIISYHRHRRLYNLRRLHCLCPVFQRTAAVRPAGRQPAAVPACTGFRSVHAAVLSEHLHQL